MKHDRERLEHEDSADERQEKLLFDDHGHSTYRSPEAERADIPHKNLSRMSVVPEKTDARSDHGSAENGKLADLGHLLQLEIFGEARVSADVSQHSQSCCGYDRAADREPVQAVGEVHCVARSHDHERHEQNERQKRDDPEMRNL